MEVGTGVTWLGRISRSSVSLTIRSLRLSLYLPEAKIRLPTSLLRSI